MKKAITVLLIAALLLGATACTPITQAEIPEDDPRNQRVTPTLTAETTQTAAASTEEEPEMDEEPASPDSTELTEFMDEFEACCVALLELEAQMENSGDGSDMDELDALLLLSEYITMMAELEELVAQLEEIPEDEMSEEELLYCYGMLGRLLGTAAFYEEQYGEGE